MSAIRYCQLLKKHSFIVNKGKPLVKNFLNLLLQNGVIVGYKETITTLQIYLKYDKYGKPVWSNVKKFIKDKQVITIDVVQMQELSFQLGLYILSTNKGLLDHFNACKLNIGGRLLFFIK
jgi:ribosomal protein S8